MNPVTKICPIIFRNWRVDHSKGIAALTSVPYKISSFISHCE
jgi:hypothetical protein